MSGHSKWATIKHKKGALDAKRGKIFTRLIKEISIAAKNGGGDVDMNPRLRTAVAAAKAENMPADNIKRAIQRGTGELPGVSYEEFTLEGYGPGGVAVLAEISTDNRNRTVSEMRHVFSKNGGNMAEAGAVAWMFHKKGDIIIPKSAAKEEDLMNIVLEAGAEDLRDDGETWEILTEPSAFEAVHEAVKKAGITPESASVAMIPQNYIKLEGSQANTMIRLMEALEDQDDVQNVHSNFDIDQKLLEEVAG
jgi:YebC/PmpR family DNA-binding regulatory protein